MIEKAIAVTGLIGAIAGGVYVMESRYQAKVAANEIHAGLQQQYQSMRLNDVEGRIIQYERDARTRELSAREQEHLRRLYREQCQLLIQLKIVQKCK